MTEARKTAEYGRPAVLGRGVVITGATLLAVGVLAAGVTVAYQLGLESGRGQTITIIRAADGPVKVRPKEPGGMAVPNRDKVIYRQMAKDADNPPAERLLPPAERPIEKLLLAVDPSASPPAGGARPAESDSPPSTPPPAGAALADAAAADETGAAATDDTGPPPAPRPKPMQHADATGGAPPPERQQAALPPSAPAARGNYLAQLAAARTDDSIHHTWRRIRDGHPALFRGLQPEFAARYLGKAKGTWHRLRVGPFADVDAARAFCARAKARKVACIVVPR